MPGCAVLPARSGYSPGRRALEMPGAPPEVHTWPDAAALESLAADIAALRPQVDVLIVSCHWGLSGAPGPVAYQAALAETAASAGADLVFGHHPHVIQGAARVGGMPVFYSLGNFAFDNPRMVGRHLDGLMLRVCSAKGVYRPSRSAGPAGRG
jgi:poly-gamma-glutamate capsule biosynthesis protein CapA/YwtB (metallophosphatase superfamily)